MARQRRDGEGIREEDTLLQVREHQGAPLPSMMETTPCSLDKTTAEQQRSKQKTPPAFKFLKR